MYGDDELKKPRPMDQELTGIGEKSYYTPRMGVPDKLIMPLALGGPYSDSLFNKRGPEVPRTFPDTKPPTKRNATCIKCGRQHVNLYYMNGVWLCKKCHGE